MFLSSFYIFYVYILCIIVVIMYEDLCELVFTL